MNILVIGNGFDLAHGLPTKYTDFLEWIVAETEFWEDLKKQGHHLAVQVNEIKIYIPENKKRKMSIHDPIEKQIELWDCINENSWLEYFLRCDMYGKENWIDFESEISQVIQSLDSNMYDKNFVLENKIIGFTSEFLFQQFSDWINKKTYKELRDKLLVDLKRLIRAFEIYLTEYVDKIEIKKISQDIGNLEIDHVLSFNYTHTYKKVYGKSKNIEYDYIHGEADIKHTIETNKMVLGIDEYLGKKKRNKRVDFIAFKKFYQRIHKQTGCKYKKWVDDIYMNYMNYINNEKKLLEQSNNGISTRQTFSFKQMKLGDEITVFDTVKYEKHNLYIFGHSLAITDKDILRDLILNDNVYTTIFYHDKDTMGQQIANLVKVIGQDELIRRTGGITKTIEFKEQQEMIPIK